MTETTTALQAAVEVHEPIGTTRAVVLVLHGGKADSFERSEPSQLSSRRVNPFVAAIHRQGRDHGVAVWKVRYRYRGWNGAAQSPAQDARWALDEVRRRHGDVPVVLMGHSMGGRTAVHVLGDPSVSGMVAFGPWLPHEPVDGAAGKKVLIAHPTRDRWTSPRQSYAWAQAARPFAQSVTYVRVRATGHFMLWNAGFWTDLAVGFTLTWLGVTPSVGRRARGVLAKAAAGAQDITV